MNLFFGRAQDAFSDAAPSGGGQEEMITPSHLAGLPPIVKYLWLSHYFEYSDFGWCQ